MSRADRPPLRARFVRTAGERDKACYHAPGGWGFGRGDRDGNSMKRCAGSGRWSVVASGIVALACSTLLAAQAPAQGGAARSDLPLVGPPPPRFAPSAEFAGGLADLVAGLCGQQAPSAAQPATKAASLPFKWKRKHVGKGNYGSIAVDPDGNPHVVYGRFIGNEFVLTHRWAEGSHWSSEVIDDGPDEITYDNSLVIDANGGLHAAYHVSIDGTDTLKYAHNAGDGWETEVVDADGLASCIVIDDDGFAHILHTGLILRYAQQTASGWELETIPAAGGLWFAGTSLRLHDGKVYAAATTADLPRHLMLAIRDSGVWSVQEIDADGFGGAMAFDQDGVLHVVYGSTAEFKHAWLAGLEWQSEALVTQTTILGEPLPDGVAAGGEHATLVEDSAGRLQLVFTLTLSKGGKHGQALCGALLAEDVWIPTMLIPKLGGDTSIAVGPTDLVHVTTKKPAGSDGGGSIVALRLKGARLSLSVAPKESGTISVAPSGLECTGKAVEFEFPGTEVMLMAAPATGFDFLKWLPSSLGTDPQVSLTMDHGRKARAVFVKTPD